MDEGGDEGGELELLVGGEGGAVFDVGDLVEDVGLDFGGELGLEDLQREAREDVREGVASGDAEGRGRLASLGEGVVEERREDGVDVRGHGIPRHEEERLVRDLLGVRDGRGLEDVEDAARPEASGENGEGEKRGRAAQDHQASQRQVS